MDYGMNFSDIWYIWILPILGAIIWWAVSSAVVKAPGDVLQSNFQKLTKDTDGKIAGKTLAEITAVCGAPNSISSVGDGKTLRQWMAGGYHIALVFDENDVCVGISSESKV